MKLVKDNNVASINQKMQDDINMQIFTTLQKIHERWGDEAGPYITESSVRVSTAFAFSCLDDTKDAAELVLTAVLNGIEQARDESWKEEKEDE
jgi:hypothetical protein